MRFFVCPNGTFRFRSADGNAVVRTVALVRTIGVMLGPNEQRHICIVARQVVSRRISLLLQSKCSRRFNNYPPGDRYTHLALSWRNRDGMVRPRKSDLLALARRGMHGAPHGASYNCDPARPIGRHKSDYVGDVLGFAESLQCLHSQRDLASRLVRRLPSIESRRL